MGANTTIQWATHTFNSWRGCNKVAEGCANCYAEAQSKRSPKTLGVWGQNGLRVVASEAMWREPVKWNRAAECHHSFDCGQAEHGDACPQSDRPRVFCASLADVFEDWRGQCRMSDGGWCVNHRHFGQFTGFGSCALAKGNDAVYLDDVRARLFRLIDATPSLDWLLLTKRPENVRRMWHIPTSTGVIGNIRVTSTGPAFRRNVWLGTSIACQEDADQNIPELLKCRDLAAKLFVSVEPLVGPVDLEKIAGPASCKYASALHYQHDDRFYYLRGAPIDWVIVGGESGPKARPCDIQWIRSIVRQCKDAGVPVFVKQLGARCVKEHAGGDTANTAYRAHGWVSQVGTAYHAGWFHFADKKGGDPAEWPEDVCVREVPT